MVTLQDFIQFLVNNNVLEAFIVNYRQESSMNETLQDLWDRVPDKKNLVKVAFAWIRSPERHCFWEDIDNKWRELNKPDKCVVNYVPVWRYKVIYNVFAPGITREETKQIEAELGKIHPEIVRFFKSGDYINGAIKEFVKLEKKGK